MDLDAQFELELFFHFLQFAVVFSFEIDQLAFVLFVDVLLLFAVVTLQKLCLLNVYFLVFHQLFLQFLLVLFHVFHSVLIVRVFALFC